MKRERRRLFLRFLNYSQELQDKIENRSGLYHSIDFVFVNNNDDHDDHHDDDDSSKNKGDDSAQAVHTNDETIQTEQQQQQQRIKVIILDTRWNRDRHCIPSVASVIPFGAAISCLTRWFVAGTGGSRWWLCFPGSSSNRSSKDATTILGEEQWTWLAQELETSTAQVHIVISSIQVLSTNPAMEGWGHFPMERERLLQLLNSKRPSGLVLLSGDVHHAEILDPIPNPDKTTTTTTTFLQKKTAFLEVTSSGLTHSCTMPFYGKLCEPLVKHFASHRRNASDYFLGRNFGTLQVDWTNQRLVVAVHDQTGDVVLTTGWRPFAWDPLTADELDRVPRTVNGHLVPTLVRWGILIMGVVGFLVLVWIVRGRSGWSVLAGGTKTAKDVKKKQE